MTGLERVWYRSSLHIVSILLLPLSWVFGCSVRVRRFFYRVKLKKNIRVSVPVIVVGNITVGGTGKTPFVIWLAHFLKQQGFTPGIVSRGVGGKQQYSPRWVDSHAHPNQVGDEAILLARRGQCPVVVGVDRVAAAKELLAKSDCNIVISDDGLQHYRLARDIEIAIVDGQRGLGNRHFLPAGPLRESPLRLTEVDLVVQHIAQSETGCDGNCTMRLCGDRLIAVGNESRHVLLKDFSERKVHAVVAIGNPVRFFQALRHEGFTVIEHVFPDHYLYQASDFQFQDALPIIMTEKDAVKCVSFADERFWYLPVVAEISEVLKAKLLRHRLFKKD